MSDEANLSPVEEQMLKLFRQLSPDERRSLLADLEEDAQVKMDEQRESLLDKSRASNPPSPAPAPMA